MQVQKRKEREEKKELTGKERQLPKYLASLTKKIKIEAHMHL